MEEFSGEQFLDEVFVDVQEHRKYETQTEDEAFGKYIHKQGSLPSYVYGFKLAKLAETLQKAKYDEIPEAGKIKFDKGEFTAPTELSKFYESEKEYFIYLLDEVTPIIKYHTSEYDEERVDSFTEKFLLIIQSYTFKESRKAHRLRLVPDRIEGVNLRIYNKSEFVTDKFLKDLEQKLNIEVESLAREKYFQGIDKGLDAKVLDKFEMLKRDDDEEFRDSTTALEQATKEFRAK